MRDVELFLPYGDDLIVFSMLLSTSSSNCNSPAHMFVCQYHFDVRATASVESRDVGPGLGLSGIIDKLTN